MNTIHTSRLDGGRVHRATLILRAYNHRFRYRIVNQLLLQGPMTAGELAASLQLTHSYIYQQLNILCVYGLIMCEDTDTDLYYSANESRLQLIKSAVSSFCRETAY